MESDRSVRRAFDKARDEHAHQEARLTEEQRRQYDALKKEQDKKREKEKKDIETTRREIEEEAKKTKSAPRRNLIPQGAMFSRRAHELQAQLNRQADQLDKTTIIQESERIKFFDNAERERARQEQLKDQGHDHSQQAERPAGQDRSDALSRAFDKAAQQQSRSQDRDHTPEKDLSRTFNSSSGRNR